MIERAAVDALHSDHSYTEASSDQVILLLRDPPHPAQNSDHSG